MNTDPLGNRVGNTASLTNLLAPSGASDSMALALYKSQQSQRKRKLDYYRLQNRAGVDPRTGQMQTVAQNPTGALQQTLTDARADASDRGFGTGGSMIEETAAPQRFQIMRNLREASTDFRRGNLQDETQLRVENAQAARRAAEFGVENKVYRKAGR